jgi:hypothetical protein
MGRVHRRVRGNRRYSGQKVAGREMGPIQVRLRTKSFSEEGLTVSSDASNMTVSKKSNAKKPRSRSNSVSAPRPAGDDQLGWCSSEVKKPIH